MYHYSQAYIEGWVDYYRSGNYQNPYEPYSTAYEEYDDGFKAAREEADV